MKKRVILFIIFLPLFAYILNLTVWLCIDWKILPEVAIIKYLYIVAFIYPAVPLFTDYRFLIVKYSYLAFIASFIAVAIYRRNNIQNVTRGRSIRCHPITRT